MNKANAPVVGDLARRNVCSAIIKNQTPGKIHCCVEYQTSSGTDNEVTEFDINGSGEEYNCEEKVHTSGNANTSSANVFPKFISSLQVKKSDGSTLELNAPFENVPHETVRHWKFIVDKDQIHSQQAWASLNRSVPNVSKCLIFCLQTEQTLQ